MLQVTSANYCAVTQSQDMAHSVYNHEDLSSLDIEHCKSHPWNSNHPPCSLLLMASYVGLIVITKMSPPSIRRRCHEFKKHRSPLICLLLMCPTSQPCHKEADFDVWDSGVICICGRKVLRAPNDAKKNLYTVGKGQRDDV